MGWRRAEGAAGGGTWMDAAGRDRPDGGELIPASHSRREDEALQSTTKRRGDELPEERRERSARSPDLVAADAEAA
jgi:hypothetical protein